MVAESGSHYNMNHKDSIPDSTTEVMIGRTIEGIQKLLNPPHDNMTKEEEAAAVISISLATQRHFEREIKMLQEASRDPDKLREIFANKRKGV